ncbi:MAG: sulfurtransferase complex subunit TusB [Candidatus Bathyarchaeota archaeon]|nr:sulfurtransferase complex subunit TusB [Candidatus Bathyarchaeota archaeon]
MKRLYILKGLDKKALQLALNSEDSGVLLMQESVYFTNKDAEDSQPLKKATFEGKEIYVLEKDAERRGIASRMVDGLKVLDYDGVVDLLFSGAKVVNL